MELLAALKNRRSIRAFKTDPVPKEVITQILEAARWSPSWEDELESQSSASPELVDQLPRTEPRRECK